MNGDYSIRDRIITEWFFQDWIGDKSSLPSPEDVFIFMKIVIDVVSVYGELSEQDRKYILGRAAIFGATQEILDKLQTYQSDSFGDINKLFQKFDLPHVKKAPTGIIYNLFRILDADHNIHPKRVEIIYTMAKKLGINEEQVQQIQNLHEEEEKLRQKRALLFFPRGFNDVLIEYQKLH